MAYKNLPAGASFRMCRKLIRGMFYDLYNTTVGSLLGTDLKVGAVEGYFEVEADGTWVNRGDSTTWDDLVNSLVGKRLSSTSGKVDYDYDENAIKFQSGGNIATSNDRVVFNLQYPHACVVDGEMRLHIHWEQPDATVRQFSVQYRIQENGATKATTWTTVVVDTDDGGASVFTYVSGTLNQITKLATIDMTGASISATVQFRLARTDSETGNILGTFVDAHVERDTHGSRTEFVK